jgi:YVTN family beta-propeller protein
MRSPRLRVLLIGVGISLVLVAGGTVASGASADTAAAARGRSSVKPPTAYVTCQGIVAGEVVPVNTATNKAGSAINLGPDPVPIAITPDGKTAYVGDYISDKVTPINTATNTAGRTIRAGSAEVAIAITPNGKTVYVVNGVSESVTPIKTATNTAGHAIAVGTIPSAIAITPSGTTAYVTNTLSDTVTPINTATNKPGKAIKVGSDPSYIAITPDGKTVYVADYTAGTVTPISTATNTPDAPIGIRSRLADAGPMAFTPGGRFLYVLGQTQDGEGALDTLTPIATATNHAGRAITVGASSQALAITP